MKLVFLAFLVTIVSCQKDFVIPEGNTIQASNETLIASGNTAFSLTANVAETQPHTYTPTTLSITANCGGFWKGLPASYQSTTIKYPLIINLTGESGLGDGSLPLKLTGPLNAALVNKRFPPNFISGGKNYSFIVITPQFRAWPTANDVNEVINYFTSTLRIDKSRIYVTGLSMGGGVTWDYAGKYASKVAAIVPVCGSHTPTQTKAKTIASNNVAVWAFHNEIDKRVPVYKTRGFVNMINKYHPVVPAKMTIFSEEEMSDPLNSHNAWTYAYSFTRKENGMNIYEWMLQYHK